MPGNHPGKPDPQPPLSLTKRTAAMEKIVDLAKIAVVAFVGVWVINHALDKFGLSSFKA